MSYVKDPDATLDYTIRWGAPPWASAESVDRYDWRWNPADGLWYMCLTPHTTGAALLDDKKLWQRQDDLWLEGPPNEQIVSTVWDVPAGLTVGSAPDDGYAATIWLSGGDVGATYEVSCEITTDNSPARVDERTFEIEIAER